MKIKRLNQGKNVIALAIASSFLLAGSVACAQSLPTKPANTAVTTTAIPATSPTAIDRELIQLILQGMIVIGFGLTGLQIRAARRQARANVLLKMFDEWNNPEVYDSIRYIHQLRREWKQADPSRENWPRLADEWVETNAPKPGIEADNSWLKRRRAAQLLDKMGYMLHAKYITHDDIFAVVPEAPRLLLVLLPLEHAIAKKFDCQEPHIAEWDRPSSKLYLQRIETEFTPWFKKTGKKLTPR